ncbi:MAG: alanine--tRNA ligase [Candidatus Theseobacter exili]|nr:alanine--tRNA ligase [Candidatus Theseobacter exili]
MESAKIRKEFLKYFENKDHRICASDSLIPSNDTTMLFTTAGMVQFKSLWAGAPLEFARAATVQKCLRAGGKGNDLENVGKTLRHHTFFEMLGNFSFGDYFKTEAIKWGWEFLTEVMNLSAEKMWVSVFENDDEAYDIWAKQIGVPENRIVRLGTQDNFWGPAGDMGACGPCSEIYFDIGPERSCGRDDCKPGCDCERYLEIWNLVFPQFYQEQDGSRRPLDRRGIDTGMGLERLAFVSQEVENNYCTDLFKPILDEIRKQTSIKYCPDTYMPYHVLADHSRTLTFALSENILPSNEGRGYVLRRILRRAVRYARNLGIEEPFLYRLCPVVVSVMKDAYPELVEPRDHVSHIVKSEEERFLNTLEVGLPILEEYIEAVKKESSAKIPGNEVFTLYDTYGFPVEMTEEIAGEQNVLIDIEGFQQCMKGQKQKARASWTGTEATGEDIIYKKIISDHGPTEFVGYDDTSSDAKIICLINNGKVVKKAEAGDTLEVILDKTPFYGNSGGQVGDTGQITGPDLKIKIMDTKKAVESLIVHVAEVVDGIVREGDCVHSQVNLEQRKQIQRHHSATHILQYALRNIFGSHIKQAGSMVSADRLRFDFTHFSGMKPDEIKRVEEIANNIILENAPVTVKTISRDQAEKEGAIALFGEKYGNKVRVITIGDISQELCGGTHVKRTGDIGLFRVLSESSAAAGIRRIEAVCGTVTFQLLQNERDVLSSICSLFKSTREDVLEKIETLSMEKRRLEKDLEKSKVQKAGERFDAILSDPKDISGVKVYSANLGEMDMPLLRNSIDYIKSAMGSGVAILGASSKKKAFFVVAVSKDLNKKGLHAGTIVGGAAKIAGGGGGGRPDMAQAGGKEPAKIEAAIDKAIEIVKESL